MQFDSATADDLRNTLATAVAVCVTPFHPDGEIDWDAHARVVKRVADAGIRVLTPNGNTGEFYTLTAAEAKRAAGAAFDLVGAQTEILVGVGLDVSTAVEAARHARDLGARMVMVHQPVHPYLSADGWYQYHKAIAEAVPETGVVLYLRDERITGEQIRLLGESCPNVIGVKYAVRDVARFAATARDAGLDRFAWLAGHAELAAPAYFAVGATGFTTGLANVVPELPLALLEALRANDYPAAMKVWETVRPFEDMRAADSSADNVSVVKEALDQLGLCDRTVRPPSRPLPEDLRVKVRSVLASWGVEAKP